MDLFDLRMLFSDMMAKTSPEFAERRTTPEMCDGAVFIYGENYDVYVKMCLLFLDATMTDESEPVVEVRSFPRILHAPFNHVLLQTLVVSCMETIQNPKCRTEEGLPDDSMMTIRLSAKKFLLMRSESVDPVFCLAFSRLL